MNTTVNQMYTPISYGGKIHIENEVILPDYCPDVSRIIKAELSPKTVSVTTVPDDSGLTVSLDATSLFKIIYLSEDSNSNNLHSTFFTETFSHSFKVQADKNSDFDNIFVHLDLIPEAVSCRPASPRRLCLRGDINVLPDLRLNRRIKYYSPDNDSCEAKCQTVNLCTMSGVTQCDYNFSERITLPAELPPIEEILDCDIRYCCDSLKITDGNIMFTSTAFFNCFYSSKDGNISFCQPLELSRQAQMGNMSEGAVCEMRFCPTSLRADTDIDNYGDSRIINLDFSCNAQFFAYSNFQQQVVSDIFVPGKEFEAQFCDFNIREHCSSVNHKIPYNTSFKLKNPDIFAIEDIRPTGFIRGWAIENDVIRVDGRLNLKMIGSYQDGNDGMEETLDFSTEIKLDCPNAQQCDLALQINQVDCVAVANSVEVRADLQIIGSVFSQTPVHCVKNLSIGENKSPCFRPPIILYYPCQDETLWEIAKKYSIPQKLLRDFNQMESDKITSSVIKIPMLS